MKEDFFCSCVYFDRKNLLQSNVCFVFFKMLPFVSFLLVLSAILFFIHSLGNGECEAPFSHYDPRLL
jgi:hypothetical protein